MDNSHAPSWYDLVKCPFCPKCGDHGIGVGPGMYQWFCSNVDCNVFAWCPWETAAKNLSDESFVDFKESNPAD